MSTGRQVIPGAIVSDRRSQIFSSSNFLWRKVDRIGSGATSEVYIGKSKNLRNSERYAIKMLSDDYAKRYQVMMQREFDLIKRMEHPNLIKLIALEVEISTRRYIIVTEYCVGKSLAHVIDRPENSYGILEEEFIRFLRDITSAIEYLHLSNIVHRDIKPLNILVHMDPLNKTIYKLTDFGAAKELSPLEDYGGGMSSQATTVGTEEFMAPGLFNSRLRRKPYLVGDGAETSQPKNDVWSFGCTVYQMAAGHLPFRPYGGSRQNRDKMNEILQHRPRGTISGIQHRPNDDVYYSKTIARSSRLTAGMRYHVVRFLQISFDLEYQDSAARDPFFQSSRAITNATPFHVFFVNACFFIMAYVLDDDLSLSELQKEIQRQTGVPEKRQYLVWRRMTLTEDVFQRNKNNLQTSKERPIWVYFQRSPDDYRTTVLQTDAPLATESSIPFNIKKPIEYPRASSSIDIDNDYILAKTGLANAFSLVRIAKDSTEAFKQLFEVVKWLNDGIFKDRSVDTQENFVFVKSVREQVIWFAEHVVNLIKTAMGVEDLQARIRVEKRRILNQGPQAAAAAANLNVLNDLSRDGQSSVVHAQSHISTGIQPVSNTLQSHSAGVTHFRQSVNHQSTSHSAPGQVTVTSNTPGAPIVPAVTPTRGLDTISDRSVGAFGSDNAHFSNAAEETEKVQPNQLVHVKDISHKSPISAADFRLHVQAPAEVANSEAESMNTDDILEYLEHFIKEFDALFQIIEKIHANSNKLDLMSGKLDGVKAKLANYDTNPLKIINDENVGRAENLRSKIEYSFDEIKRAKESGASKRFTPEERMLYDSEKNCIEECSREITSLCEKTCSASINRLRAEFEKWSIYYWRAHLVNENMIDQIRLVRKSCLELLTRTKELVVDLVQPNMKGVSKFEIILNQSWRNRKSHQSDPGHLDPSISNVTPVQEISNPDDEGLGIQHMAALENDEDINGYQNVKLSRAVIENGRSRAAGAGSSSNKSFDESQAMCLKYLKTCPNQVDQLLKDFDKGGESLIKSLSEEFVKLDAAHKTYYGSNSGSLV